MYERPFFLVNIVFNTVFATRSTAARDTARRTTGERLCLLIRIFTFYNIAVETLRPQAAQHLWDMAGVWGEASEGELHLLFLQLLAAVVRPPVSST
jgi:hypothetical protein